jgi:hypothetical protein
MVNRLCWRWSLRKAVGVAQDHFKRETRGLESRFTEGVHIFGGESFAAEVGESLKRLQAQDVYGYRLVRRYVYAIVESMTPPPSGRFIGVVYQKTNDARRLPWSVSRFAALLVRRALTVRLIIGFGLPSSSRSELLRLRRELRTMELLNCHPSSVREQLAQIEKAETRCSSTRAAQRMNRGPS